MERLYSIKLPFIFFTILLYFDIYSQFQSSTQIVGGEVYKEFVFLMRNNNVDWRVTDPNATYVGTPGNSPSDFLPNPVFNLNVDDLSGAIRAELVIDAWGGHVGTTGKKVRFNNNPWLTIPELTSTPTSGQCYTQQITYFINVPTSHLRIGTNSFEGTSGGQTCYNFNWGQWGWYGVILRIYYNPSGKPIAIGQITSHQSGGSFMDNPTFIVSVSGTATQVDLIGFYEDYDYDGDGYYTGWQRNYHRHGWTDVTMNAKNHIGTSYSSPYNITWNTKWIPDQAPGSIKIVALIKSSAGYWYVTPIVENLTLVRQNSSVRVFKPYNVPQNFWVRANQTKSSKVSINSLQNALEAALIVRTWNGREAGATDWTKVNSYQLPTRYGRDHFYSVDVISIPVNALLAGENTISFFSATTHHGIEILWPGPAVVVRYGSAPVGQAPTITSQPQNQTVQIGQTATFSVMATGTPPLNYQWRKNGQIISGATSAVYTTPPTIASDNGAAFSVVITNNFGTVTSQNAILTVTQAPPPPPASENLIQNPGFESGSQNWIFFTNGAGSFTTGAPAFEGSRSAIISISNVGSNTQLYQTNITLEPNQEYELVFAARSSNGNDLSVSIQKHTSPFTNYGLNLFRFDLTSEFKLFYVKFKASNISSTVADARLMFWFVGLAQSGAVYNIDEIVLRKTTETPPPPPISVNIIKNYDFEAGKTNWSFYSSSNAQFNIKNQGISGSNAAEIAIQTTGDNIQLFQFNLSLKAATKYKLSFYAKSNINASFRASVLKHTSPFTNYGLWQRTFTLNNSMNQYSAEFTAPNFTGGTVSDARLMFQFGSIALPNSIYYFDNIELIEISSASNLMSSEDNSSDENDNRQNLTLKNYPNPFNPETKIVFRLKEGGNVEFQIFNILGERVYFSSKKFYDAGEHSFVWNASDFSAGIYICLMTYLSDNGMLSERQYIKLNLIK